ncbi:MAG: hypothetical protein M3142_01225, partial [Bacteroidota bacterium]|nr:hypothetical protein [Bacteroidota bacterium]
TSLILHSTTYKAKCTYQALPQLSDRLHYVKFKLLGRNLKHNKFLTAFFMEPENSIQSIYQASYVSNNDDQVIESDGEKNMLASVW